MLKGLLTGEAGSLKMQASSMFHGLMAENLASEGFERNLQQRLIQDLLILFHNYCTSLPREG
jgi:cytoplasmic iron level regulating protein YaaA (DUF328/UPF0246 family)